MQERTLIHELIVAAAAVLVLVVLWNPLDFWMPDAVTYLAIGGLAILFFLFAGLLWREKSYDEREEYHAFLAARLGYTAGLVILVCSIAYEAVTEYHINTLLLLTLGGMILAKVVGYAWGRVRR